MITIDGDFTGSDTFKDSVLIKGNILSGSNIVIENGGITVEGSVMDNVIIKQTNGGPVIYDNCMLITNGADITITGIMGGSAKDSTIIGASFAALTSNKFSDLMIVTNGGKVEIIGMLGGHAENCTITGGSFGFESADKSPSISSNTGSATVYTDKNGNLNIVGMGGGKGNLVIAQDKRNDGEMLGVEINGEVCSNIDILSTGFVSIKGKLGNSAKIIAGSNVIIKDSIGADSEINSGSKITAKKLLGTVKLNARKGITIDDN